MPLHAGKQSLSKFGIMILDLESGFNGSKVIKGGFLYHIGFQKPGCVADRDEESSIL
jgi:hypothetical protein